MRPSAICKLLNAQPLNQQTSVGDAEKRDTLRSDAEPLSRRLVHTFPEPDLDKRLQLAVCQYLETELDEGEANLASDGVCAVPISPVPSLLDRP